MFEPSKEASVDLFVKKFKKLLLDSDKDKYNSTQQAAMYMSLSGYDLDNQLQSLKMQEEWGLLKGEECPKEFRDDDSVEGKMQRLKYFLFPANSCGETANVLYKIMDQSREGTKNLTTMKERILQSKVPQAIRLTLGTGHEYIILITEKDKNNIPWGYILQSNIASTMYDHGFSLATWFKDPKSEKINIAEHIEKLSELVDVNTKPEKKKELYQDLFMANPVVEINKPADLDRTISDLNKKIQEKGNDIVMFEIKDINVNTMLENLDKIQKATITNCSKLNQDLDAYLTEIVKPSQNMTP